MKATCRINLGVSQCSQEAASSNNTFVLGTNEFQLIYAVKQCATKLEKSTTLSHLRNSVSVLRTNYWKNPGWTCTEVYSRSWINDLSSDGPTFIRIVPGRCLQERDAGSEWHVLLVFLLEAVGTASFLVSLSFLALHLLFVDGPSLQLLRSPLLRRAQPLQAGRLVQLLKLLDQLQVVGHDAGRGGWCWRTDVRIKRPWL